MTVALAQHASPAVLDHAANEAASDLHAALSREGFAGWDPYDALSSPLVSTIARGAFLRRASIQALKRLPVNVRPVLSIPRARHTKALALLASAYVRLGDHETATELANELAARARPRGDGVGWAYDFDVRTRWGSYDHRTPNAVATAFAADALLDTGVSPELAARARVFALERLLRTGSGGAFFAYHEGATEPIHNASLLLVGVIARAGTDEEVAAAEPALAGALNAQRADGSWPYGASERLAWVDGYHTAYNLDALARWVARTDDAGAQDALDRGLALYLDRLFDADGAAKASPESRFPVDIHACATAVTVLSRLGRTHPEAQAAARKTLTWTLDHMRRGDGRFAFQLHRWYRNSIPYLRWSDAHMLLALATYLEGAADA